jgi:hypothetical protein
MSLFKNSETEQAILEAFKNDMQEEAKLYAPVADSLIKTIVSEGSETLNESVEELEVTIADTILSEGAINKFMNGEIGAPGAEDVDEWLQICEDIQAKLEEIHLKVTASKAEEADAE